METYISILRGINVGGHRKIKMADLRDLYTDLGYENVKSYIQSGNVVFQSDESNAEKIEKELEEAILEKFGFEVPVIVRSKQEWEEVLQENPFLEQEKTEHLYCAFLAQTPQLDELEKLQSYQTDDNQIRIIGKHVFLLSRGPLHKTPLTHQRLERYLKTNATVRSWKGVLKIWEMI